MDKRLSEDGTVQYLVKWLGFTQEQSTWEPVQNMDCDEFIAEFENSRQQEAETSVVQNNNISPTPEPTPTRQENDDASNGDDSTSLKAECVIGITTVSGEKCFLIKWKGSNKSNLIPARIANVKYPQEVIAFYQNKLRFG